MPDTSSRLGLVIVQPAVLGVESGIRVNLDPIPQAVGLHFIQVPNWLQVLDVCRTNWGQNHQGLFCGRRRLGPGEVHPGGGSFNHTLPTVQHSSPVVQ